MGQSEIPSRFLIGDKWFPPDPAVPCLQEGQGQLLQDWWRVPWATFPGLEVDLSQGSVPPTHCV